jgi:hypothetical protein
VKSDLSFVADSALLVLGEYLHHLSSIREQLPSDIREEARIGADVIVASTQYSAAAREGLDQSSDEVRPLPVFAMVRSAIYGLIFLENVDYVRAKKEIPSPGRFVSRSVKRWEREKIGDSFGTFESNVDHHKRWADLSQYVHSIPEIKKEGGSDTRWTSNHPGTPRGGVVMRAFLRPSTKKQSAVWSGRPDWDSIIDYFETID